MDPATLAIATAALFFSEALKEGGKTLGQKTAEAMTKLASIVRQKFQATGTAGVLARAEKQPTQSHIEQVKAELVVQMEEDSPYAAQLRDLLAELEAAGVVRQMMASGIEAEGDVEAGSMRQKARESNNVQQEMLTNVKAKNIRVDELNQES